METNSASCFDNKAFERRKTKLGVFLTLVYALIYSGFIGINVFYPDTMGLRMMRGMNLASVYGIALILLAAVMAFIYNFFCKSTKNEKSGKTSAVTDNNTAQESD